MIAVIDRRRSGFPRENTFPLLRPEWSESFCLSSSLPLPWFPISNQFRASQVKGPDTHTSVCVCVCDL